MFHANPAGIINPMEKNFSFIFIEILIRCFLRTLEIPIIINWNRLALIFKSGARRSNPWPLEWHSSEFPVDHSPNSMNFH